MFGVVDKYETEKIISITEKQIINDILHNENYFFRSAYPGFIKISSRDLNSTEIDFLKDSFVYFNLILSRITTGEGERALEDVMEEKLYNDIAFNTNVSTLDVFRAFFGLYDENDIESEKRKTFVEDILSCSNYRKTRLFLPIYIWIRTMMLK